MRRFDLTGRTLAGLLALGLTDVFRAWHPQVEGAYTWWSMRLNKRLENRGWRLDYFLISEALLPMMQSRPPHGHPWLRPLPYLPDAAAGLSPQRAVR